MSTIETINERQEFEAINKKTSKRNADEDTVNHSIEVKAKTKAVISIVLTVFALAIVMAGIIGLYRIGWINDTFRIVLMCLAGAVASFKVGYFWHETKF